MEAYYWAKITPVFSHLCTNTNLWCLCHLVFEMFANSSSTWWTGALWSWWHGNWIVWTIWGGFAYGPQSFPKNLSIFWKYHEISKKLPIFKKYHDFSKNYVSFPKVPWIFQYFQKICQLSKKKHEFSKKIVDFLIKQMNFPIFLRLLSIFQPWILQFLQFSKNTMNFPIFWMCLSILQKYHEFFP